MAGLVADSLSAVPLLTLTVERTGADQIFRRMVTRAGARAGVGDAVLGVCPVGSTADGDVVPVDVLGQTLVEAGGALDAGALFTPDADGRAVAAARSAIRQTVVNGAAANTDIPVAGLAVDDELLSVAATDASSVGDATIHSAGNIRCTMPLGTQKLIVLWRKPPVPLAGRTLAAATAAGDFVPALLLGGGLSLY